MQGVLLELTLLASDIKLNGQGRHPLDFPMTPMLRAAAREARPRSPSPPVHPSASRSVALSTPASPTRGREGGRYRVPKRAISPWGNHLSLHQDKMMTPAVAQHDFFQLWLLEIRIAERLQFESAFRGN